MNLYERIASGLLSKLKRGLVWRYSCGRKLHVDSTECLARGWPKCCGSTMTNDDQKPYRSKSEMKRVETLKAADTQDKPEQAPPREFWRDVYEKLECPLEKFQFLCGLKELSWEDCQDSWFESQKIMPDIVVAYDAIARKLEQAEEDVRFYRKEWESACERERYRSDELAEAKAKLAEVDPLIPKAIMVPGLVEKLDTLREENARLKAEVVRLEKELDDAFLKPRKYLLF